MKGPNSIRFVLGAIGLWIAGVLIAELGGGVVLFFVIPLAYLGTILAVIVDGRAVAELEGASDPHALFWAVVCVLFPAAVLGYLADRWLSLRGDDPATESDA